MTSFEDRLLKRVRRMAKDLQDGNTEQYRVTKIRVDQVAPPSAPPEYTSARIRELREKKLRVSQTLFSQIMVMSLKTIQAWEQGTRVPKGPVLRLFQVIEQDPQHFLKTFEEQRSPGAKRAKS